MDTLVPTPRLGSVCATNPCKSSPALVVVQPDRDRFEIVLENGCCCKFPRGYRGSY